MSISNRVMGPLGAVFPTGGLFAAWLNEQPIPAASGAAAELAAALAAPDPSVPAPLWQDGAFAELLPAAFRDLPQGPAVVVTGQQPGFLGGPLLTLYKIATAIRLAQRRTAAGKPTVPVFWSGDDDDDLAEALAPVGWDTNGKELLRSPDRELLKNPQTERAILAELGADHWAEPALQHLHSAPEVESLPAGLLASLQDAVAANQSWGVGQAELLARIFTGSDLVIIRGHDENLHRQAAPFYDRISGRLPELADLARQRGAELAAAGFQAQISDRSLSRPLFQVVAGRREVIQGAEFAVTAQLRPGVMLRSPVQDYLLRPVAVVVGPGELAYLRQLDPLYAALSVPRSPLIPRLCAWVLPERSDPEELPALLRGLGNAGSPGSSDQAEAWADQVIGPARTRMAELLAGELRLTPERAAAMADNRARRFRKGVVAMFKAEVARLEQKNYAGFPGWVLPDGQRQERTLGLLSALGLSGGDLVPAILAAAEQHLACAEQGAWQEMAMVIPEGTALK